MSTPKSIEELAKHIEQGVEGYVVEGRRVAFAAMERAFSGPSKTQQSSATPRPKGATGKPAVRRSGEELAELRTKLCELVRRHPGEAMVTFATELDTSVRELGRPISVLKREGRVRTVGQRYLTRYWTSPDFADGVF